MIRLLSIIDPSSKPIDFEIESSFIWSGCGWIVGWSTPKIGNLINKSNTKDLLVFRLEHAEYLISRAKKRLNTDVPSDDDSENRRGFGRTADPYPHKCYDGFEHWLLNEDLKNHLGCRMEGCDSRTWIKDFKCDLKKHTSFFEK